MARLDPGVRDLLVALRDLLDVPLAERWEDRRRQRDLTRERQFAAYLVLDDLVENKGPTVHDPVVFGADLARRMLAGAPVTYTPRNATTED